MDASNSQFFVKERVVWDCFIPMGPLLVVITAATTTAAAAFTAATATTAAIIQRIPLLAKRSDRLWKISIYKYNVKN